jgi:hypothetical protein
VAAGYAFARELFWPQIGERLAATYSDWVEARATSPS